MEQLLYHESGLRFVVSDHFEGRMLTPILENLLDKAQSAWDDYDEASRCCRLVEEVRRTPGLHMEFHTARRGEAVAGLALVTSGPVLRPPFFSEGLLPGEPEDGALAFNYFHISPAARGFGEHWLRDIILPRCRAQGFRAVYVKSSHPRAFSLYRRLGTELGSSRSPSDNGLYLRRGLLFRIPLSGPESRIPSP